MKQRIPRRAQRYAVRLEIQALNGQPVTDAFVVDISSLGARLETTQPLAPRNHVEFAAALPGEETPTVFAGQVVWLQPLMTAPGRYHVGLRFFSPQWDIDRLGRAGQFLFPI